MDGALDEAMVNQHNTFNGIFLFIAIFYIV
jgi:hypothetical protein